MIYLFNFNDFTAVQYARIGVRDSSGYYKSSKSLPLNYVIAYRLNKQSERIFR